MILFETPGLLDLRAFTTMGLTAKPNSRNPIGMFGTGLKYAVAVLVRNGASVVVWVGRDKYTFETLKDEFRGKAYEKMRMRREKWSLTRATYTELPFTIEYGRNWEMWMAYRELESNTRDEGGETYAIDPTIHEDFDENEVKGRDDYTRIIVDDPAFDEAYRDRDTIFLPGAIREGEGIQILRKSNEHLFWRGLRVHKLSKKPLFTYNFLDQLQLTEDRTLYLGDYYARAALARFVVACDDEELIEKVITADEDVWEHGLEFNRYDRPSAAFHNVMMRHPKGVHSNVWGYYGHHDQRPAPKELSLFEKHPRPWRIVGDAAFDAKNVRVFDAPYDYSGRWEWFAAAILAAGNLDFDPKLPRTGNDDADDAGNDDHGGIEAAPSPVVAEPGTVGSTTPEEPF